ncbi:aldehyde dehydrogenase family protein [Streptomyces sp. CA-100214]
MTAPSRMLIDGQFVDSPERFAVEDPATGESFATAPDGTPEQLDRAMAAAQRAFPAWAADEDARRVALRSAADRIERRAEEIAELVVREQGKPFAEALSEPAAAAATLRWCADAEIPSEVLRDDSGAKVEVMRRPLGVVAAITPWNVPALMPIWKIAPALRTGNTLVLKPSEVTPLTALLLGRIFNDLLPPGVLNIVTGASLGPLMTAHPTPRKVAFTGSIATGKLVAQSAIADLKRLTLELGGNGAAVVLDDADLELTVPMIVSRSMRNAGQVCACIKRVYVADGLYDDFVEALTARVAELRVGPGMEPGVELGPLSWAHQRNFVAGLVEDALANGATVTTGGRVLDRPGYFHEPTVLVGVEDGQRVVDEEQFGPVLPIMRFRDDEEALVRANRGHYGLTSSIWSSDLDRGRALASRLQTGVAGVNVHGQGVLSGPGIPFGGRAWSGVGVENGIAGLLGYTDIQVFGHAVLDPPSQNA